MPLWSATVPKGSLGKRQDASPEIVAEKPETGFSEKSQKLLEIGVQKLLEEPLPLLSFTS